MRNNTFCPAYHCGNYFLCAVVI